MYTGLPYIDNNVRLVSPSRVMSSVIDQSIKQYLFQPQVSQLPPENKPLKLHSNNTSAPGAEVSA